MNRRKSIVCLVLTVAGLAQALPTILFEDATSDENWNNPANWSTGVLPGTAGLEWAKIIGGQTAYLDSEPAPTTAYDVFVSNGPPGGSAFISANHPYLRNIRVANSENAVGTWTQSAGTVDAVNLFVGASGAGSGVVRLFGGGMNVSDQVALNDSAMLIIHGDASRINADDMTLNDAATLQLVVGETGDTLITLAGALTVDSTNSQLEVDCGFYSGGSSTIELVKYSTLSGPFAATNMTLQGLAGAYSGSLSTDSDSLNAVITVDETTTNLFFPSGDWATPALWSAGVPTNTSFAIINNGSTATVSHNLSETVELVGVGNTPHSNTLLQIESDFLAGRLWVGFDGNGVGHVMQTDGDATMLREFQIASTTAGGTNSGSYTIHGGSLDFPYATLSVGISGEGSFRVEGSLVDDISGDGLKLGTNGALNFVLDRAGVTPFNLSGSFEFEAGSSITVDGTLYQGSTAYFPLIRGGRLEGAFDPAMINFVGLDGRNPEIITDGGGLWIRLNAGAQSALWSGELTGLFPTSTIAAVTADNTLSISSAYNPSESLWGAIYSQAHVMDTLMSNDNTGDADLSWDLRMGRGGQIYSLRCDSIGEIVPPNNYAGSPWIDSVWQGGGANSDKVNYPDFGIHQAGMYLQDPVRQDPYYSPMVAGNINAGSRNISTVNWATIPQSQLYTDEDPDNDWKSTFLFYNRYRDLGDGVIEVTLGLYNYGPIPLHHLNLPWGGVRRSSVEYAFMSDTNGSWYATDGYTNLFVKNKDTGGWIAYSDSTNGVSSSLGVVFGYGDTPFEPGSENQDAYLRSNYYTSGNVPQPDDTIWRNGHTFTAIRKFDLNQGKGVWARYYFVLGDDVSDVEQRIADRNLVAGATLTAFDYTEANTPLLGYSVSGDTNAYQIVETGISAEFYLYAHPVNGSFPVYEIAEKYRAPYLSCSPYANGAIKQYDGTIAGVRLLGFAPRTADADTATYHYGSLSSVLSPYSSYYEAAGETLSVRLAGNSGYDAWAERYDLSGDDALPSVDVERDGLDNLMEYALGGNPTNADAASNLPTFQSLETGGTSWFYHVHNERTDDPSLAYTILLSTNLVSNGWKTNGVEFVDEIAFSNVWKTVTNRVDTTGKTNEFIRLVIEAL